MQRSSETIGAIAAALAKAQPNSSIQKNRWSEQSGLIKPVEQNGHFIMPRCRAGSISCAKL
jgi:hypothetical protein